MTDVGRLYIYVIVINNCVIIIILYRINANVQYPIVLLVERLLCAVFT